MNGHDSARWTLGRIIATENCMTSSRFTCFFILIVVDCGNLTDPANGSVASTLLILHKHPLMLLLLEKTANVHLCLLATPTKSHPHKFNYCDLSLRCCQHLQNLQSKVHAKHNSIMVHKASEPEQVVDYHMDG